MKVYTALMLDEEEVADHNCPTVLVAAHPGILLSKVREHVKNTSWMHPLDVNEAEVDTMSIDEINKKLVEAEATMFIQVEEHEV